MAVVRKQEKTSNKKKVKQKSVKLSNSWWGNFDKLMLTSIVILLILSVIFVFSTSMHYALFTFSGSNNPYFFVVRQVIFAALGLVVYFFITKIPTKLYRKYWMPISLAVIALMIIPLFFGEVNGAKRWIPLPGFQIQPGEIAKLGIILIWAVAIPTKYDDYVQRDRILKKKKASFARRLKRFWLSWRWPVVFTFILIVLFRLQVDNGSMVISVGLVFVMFFASGYLPEKSKYAFWGLFFLLLVALLGLYMYLSRYTTDELVKLAENGHVLKRFVAWVNPFADYGGSGYQLSNSLIAISEGGLFGKGIGQGIQKQGFLVEGYNDFIIANIIEEIGILGVTGIFLLYIIIISRGYKIAREARNPYDMLVATGITTLFFFQAFWNSAGVVGLIPMKGLTAPLLSYGGASLLTMLSSLAILQRVHIQNQITKKRIQKQAKNKE